MMLKWIWKIIWRLILVPLIATVVVMIVSLFFINDVNQDVERTKQYHANYGTAHQHYSNQADENPTMGNKFNSYNSMDTKRYNRKHVEMEQDDFDLSGLISTITLFATFIFMLIYTIIDIRDQLKKTSEGSS